MQIQIVGVLEAQLGDTIHILDDIRGGDIVVLDRVGPNQLEVRRLSEQAAASFQGHRYRVDRGDEPGSVKITLFEDQPVEMRPKRWWEFWK